ncbi:Lipid A 3-O-deacylase (PagL) [Devosia equisanguinis]|uniref:Lipid A 3-O-deacylase (PagL) n=1 Tax=Devosia equisanguinis TaxID=2490941 RepID=A0A447IAJ6_9HYPH|nr:acyloxyacyl hydrolase [Devosia equisanguinis]VDS04433.1 Lipid A 3-O-deacylase (PagL) [Devosia equisanguinis]
MARNSVILAGLIMLVATPAMAQNLLDPHPLAGVVDELRIGLHAHDVHHAALPFSVNQWRLNQIEDISFDLLFTSPDLDVFRWLGSPRPEVGATLNLGGKDSMAHLGLTWQLPIFETPVYLEGTFGAAIHDGALTGAAPGRKNFGCQVNFYERFGVGMHVSDNVTATLTYEHTSNNGWCQANDGLSNFGLRLGWKF